MCLSTVVTSKLSAQQLIGRRPCFVSEHLGGEAAKVVRCLSIFVNSRHVVYARPSGPRLIRGGNSGSSSNQHRRNLSILSLHLQHTLNSPYHHHRHLNIPTPTLLCSYTRPFAFSSIGPRGGGRTGRRQQRSHRSRRRRRRGRSSRRRARGGERG